MLMFCFYYLFSAILHRLLFICFVNADRIMLLSFSLVRVHLVCNNLLTLLHFKGNPLRCRALIDIWVHISCIRNCITVRVKYPVILYIRTIDIYAVITLRIRQPFIYAEL